jgi:magnesium transporter
MLSLDIRIAFFVTIIVYLSDAVGSQTESVYVRALASGKNINLKKYFFRESLIGFGLGALSGMAMFAFVILWMKSVPIATTVALTMVINLTIAPVLAILIPSIINKENMDPALGAGPISTIIQDMISILVYFLIASLIVF